MTRIAELYSRMLDGPHFSRMATMDESNVPPDGVRKMKLPPYHIDVFWTDEDGCWIANVPDLKYCSAHGATPEEAAREVAIAMELWLEVAAEHGDSIPEPSYRSAVSTFARAA